MAALGAVALVSSCTPDVEPEPTVVPPADPGTEDVAPPLGSTAGIVLPPADAVDEQVLAAMEADIAELAASLGPEVREVRPYLPPADPFVADLVGVLTERGTDLVCAIGSGARSVIDDATELHPELRYCAAPGGVPGAAPSTTDGADGGDAVADANGASGVNGADGESNVEWLEVRTEELGHVVGVAARAAAGSDPVGLVMGSPVIRDAAFRDGILAGLAGSEVVEVAVTDGKDAVAAVEEVIAAGAGVVVVDGVAGASEAVAVAAGSALLLGPAALFGDEEIAQRATLTWQIDWGMVLRRPFDLLLGAEYPSPGSLGLSDGVFDLTGGPAATTTVRRAVEGVVAQLLAGSRDPLAPAPDPPGPADASRGAVPDERADPGS